MYSFEARPDSGAAAPIHEGLDDDELAFALLTESREVFSGYSNFDALAKLPIRSRRPTGRSFKADSR